MSRQVDFEFTIGRAGAEPLAFTGKTTARVDADRGIYMIPLSSIGRTRIRRAVAGVIDGRPIERWARVVGADPHLRLFTRAP